MTPPEHHSNLAHIQHQLEPPTDYILALMARVVECWFKVPRQEARVEHLRKELTDGIRRETNSQNLERNPSQGH